MTTVVVTKQNGLYKGFTCMGHAGYARKRFGSYEPDILCAAISVLTENCINGLVELAGEKLTVSSNAETGFLNVVIDEPLKETSLILIDSMVMSLQELSKRYGDRYLQINFKEV